MLEKLQSGERIWDDRIPGLCVRCQRTAKTFGLQVRVNGRQRWLTIGRWGVLTVEEARQRARLLLGRLAAGEDVAAQRERLKHLPTIDELATQFVAQHVRIKLKPGSVAEYERLLRDCILTPGPSAPRADRRGRPSAKSNKRPRLGHLRVDALTTADVIRFHAGLSSVPYEANRALAVLSKLMSFAEQQGVRAPGSNPCRGVAKFGEQARERFLSNAEFVRLAETLDEVERSGRMSPFIVAALRLLIVTGARRDEIRTLRWSYIDWDRRMAFLPDSKTGRKVIHLSTTAISLLEVLPRVDGNPFVFAGRFDANGAPQPIRDLQGPWTLIRERAGLPETRIHDLRHSFASLLAASGTPLLVVGRLLGHRNVSTTARYAHLADDPLQSANEVAAEQLGGPLLRQARTVSAPALLSPIASRRPSKVVLSRAHGDSVLREMSRHDLRRRIERLVEHQPLTVDFERRLGALTGWGRHRWYRTQKEHWLGWLGGYDSPGAYNRADYNRTPKFIYNHVVCPPMVVWLAEAVGAPTVDIERAIDAALAPSLALNQRAAAIRAGVPWQSIEALLQTPRSTSR